MANGAKKGEAAKVAIITGCFVVAAAVVSAVALFLKPGGPIANSTVVNGSNFSKSPILIGNTASNVVLSYSDSISGGSVMSVGGSNISGGPIGVAGNRGVTVSLSTNVKVTTAGDMNVAPGAVGINQGTINQSAGGKEK